MSDLEAFFPVPRRRPAAAVRSFHLPPGASLTTAQRWQLSGTVSTVDQYAAAIERFEAFCQATSFQAQPAVPEAVVAFICHRRAVEKKGQDTLDADARAIRIGHLACGLPDPTDHPAVREALGRKRRIIRSSSATALTAAALTPVDEITQSARATLARIGRREVLPVGGLSLAELEPIAKFFKLRSIAPATRCSYGEKLDAYRAFCDCHGLCPLPGDLSTVCAFLTEYGLTRGPSSVGVAKAAIRWLHREAGFASPTDHPHVADLVKGHAREWPGRKQQKYAFTTEDVAAMCEAMERKGGLGAIRDKALLLLGFAGAFRRSEMTSRVPYSDVETVYLDFADIRFTRFGVRVTLRKSKTDQEGQGQEVFVTCGASKNLCAVVALKNWIEVLQQRRITSGPVFRSFFRRGDPLLRDAKIRDRPLCSRSVADRLKYWAEQIGLDPKTVGGHSLRAGHATTAARNGASPFSIAHQGRWKSLETVRQYVRRGKEHQDNSSLNLGL